MRPRVSSKRQMDPLPRLKKTLGEHYRKKREHYGLDHPDFYDSDLRNLFSDAPQYAKNPSAARFVRRIRREVRSTVASFTDSYQYTIDQLLEKIIERCRELNLRLTDSEEVDQDRLHGLSHGPDDELPAQRPAPGGVMSATSCASSRWCTGT